MNGRTQYIEAPRGRLAGLVIGYAGRRADEVLRRVTEFFLAFPQGRRVFGNMTVLENLRLGAYLRRDATEVARTLDMVYQAFPRLKERETQRSGSLSGGEQQMLAIGRALMASPTLIMADEMSQGLAPVIVQEVYRRLLEVNRQGVTILLVEQNAWLAFKLAQFVYVMEQGRVVLEGPSAEVAASEHVQKAYLGVS